MFGSIRSWACVAILFCITTATPVAATEAVEAYARRSPVGDVVAPLGEALFGDQVGYYTGATRFSVVDVALPGKGPTMAVGRTHVVGSKGGRFSEDLDGPRAPGLFGEWDLDIPHLRGVFSLQFGWQVVGASPHARCSAPRDAATMRPPDLPFFYGDAYWDGHFLHLPGQGEQRMLLATTPASERPQGSSAFRWNTLQHWYFSCTPLKNGPGEGFIGHAPDGTKYWFNHLVHQRADTLIKWKLNAAVVERAVGMLYPTLVEDRHGNRTHYAWVGDRLEKMLGTDGSEIDLGYALAGSGLSTSQKIAWISDGTHTWRYAYSPEGYLRTVTLPDGSAWQLQSAVPYLEAYPVDYNDPRNNVCTARHLYQPKQFTYRMTHPSGAVGEFVFAPTTHGRARVFPACGWDAKRQEDPNRSAGTRFFAISLVRKKVSGIGVAERAWDLVYSGHPGSLSTCGDCGTIKYTEVTDNTGHFVRHYFSMHFGVSEGRLLEQHEGRNGQILRKAWHHLDTPAISPSPRYRRVLGVTGDHWGKDPSDGMQLPAFGMDLQQDATMHHWRVDKSCHGTFCFDAFARPQLVRRSNGTGAAKREGAAFHDDRQRWILGRLQRTTIEGIEVERTEFDAVANPIRVHAFGKLRNTYAWDGDGTLASESDGNGNTTRYASWRHGVPRRIDFADGAAEVRTVNANGTIASVVDSTGNKTCFEYDAMRRPSRIVQTSEAEWGMCDTSAYAPTTIAFTKGHAAVYGMPAGHWRRTTTTGNGRHVTVFDALWRPVVDQWVDLGDVANTMREEITRYDANGRVVFRSYPMHTNGQAHYADAALKGTHTAYDGLGRVVRVEEDSELGRLATRTEYLPNGQLRVTNPRGFATTTHHQFFDRPDYSRPTTILHPGDIRTDITRDVFGKPTSITRSGPGG